MSLPTLLLVTVHLAFAPSLDSFDHLAAVWGCWDPQPWRVSGFNYLETIIPHSCSSVSPCLAGLRGGTWRREREREKGQTPFLLLPLVGTCPPRVLLQAREQAEVPASKLWNAHFVCKVDRKVFLPQITKQREVA